MSIETYNRRDLKKQRMKQYFLDAAKELIVKEGVEAVSVRKVADLAGYSYGTIYNYFADLNELLWQVKAMLIKEIGVYIYQNNHPDYTGIKRLKSLFRTYVAYHVENPQVYRFFYLYNLKKPVTLRIKTEEVNFDEAWKNTFEEFVHKGLLDEKDIEILSKLFIYTMHGMLTLYFSNNEYLAEQNIYNDLEKIIDYIIKEEENL